MGFKEELLNKPSGALLHKKLAGMAKDFNLHPKKNDETDVWRAVLSFARNKPYLPGGPSPTTMILNNLWNCESLSFLIIYLTGYVRDKCLNPLQCAGGWTEAQGRRLSSLGLHPNMTSISPPNVSMDGKPVRYSFASHMWAKIDSMELDAITGLAGPAVSSSWPIVVPRDNLIHSLGLTTYELVPTKTRGNGMKEFNLEARS
jgi:hypothetical protein